MQEFIDWIYEVGKPFSMTVSTPFLMNKPNAVWFIDEGNINIYTVKLEDGEQVGKRYYFFNTHKNDLIFGFQEGFEVSFSADATEDTQVYEVDLDLLKNKALDPKFSSIIAQLTEKWLKNVSYALADNANFPNEQADDLVQANERIILRNDELISAQRELVFAKIKGKRLSSLSVNNTEPVATSETDILLPLSRRMFLKSDRNVGMKFLSSEEAIQEDGFWEGIKILHEITLNIEKSEIEFIRNREETLLKAKYQNLYRQTAQTLQDTEGILNKKSADKYAQSIDTFSDDPLFNACQIVGSADNLHFTPAVHTSQTDDPLGDIARASKLPYREVLLEKNWFQSDAGALLGFLKDSEEPVAIMPIKGRKYEIYNPATKETFVVNQENVELIDKVAYQFFKPFPNKKISVRNLLSFSIFKERRDLYWLLLMGFSASVLNLLSPVLTAVLFDFVIPNAEKMQIIYIGFALFMALIGYVLFEVSENFALLRLETKMDMRLQAALWDRLLNLPASFFRKFTTGDLADRTAGMSEIRDLLSGVVTTSILGGLFSLLNFFLLFYYSAILALIALALVFVQVFFIYLLGKRQINKEREAMEYEGRTQGIILQLLTGIAKFRVTGTEIRAFTHWLHSFNQMKRASFEASKIANTQTIFTSLMPIVANMIIYFALIRIVGFETMSTGEFLAFNAAYGAFMGAMIAMSGSLLSIFQIFPIYERTKPILETLPEIDNTKANPGKLRGEIEISQVNFRYEADAPLVLQDVSMHIEAGDYVAFVGGSGSGKSTLVRLLLGFENAESGGLFYDDQELSQIDLRLLRRQIGTVLQDGKLMPGDIFSNIVGTSPYLTLDDAWEAAKLAAVEEDIKQMPMGMHTVISEDAGTLSGGQKQRILIARTLVHKPRVIIFDEATSALDNQTQSVITESLNKLQATRIVIAHRLSTIKEVDKIFVFDKGKIVQQGSYQELLAKEGIFQTLAERQMV